VRLNDKALSIATGLVLLVGVGAMVQMGDKIFTPASQQTRIARADTGAISMTDAPPINYKRESLPTGHNIKVASLTQPDTALVSDLAFLHGEVQPSSFSASPKTTGTLKIDPLQTACGLTLTAKPLRGARVLLDIIAPCHTNKVVTISHAGLRFTEITDSAGRIRLTIPVLYDPANIKVSFADGMAKSISIKTKDLSSLQRTLIAWGGQVDLQLQVNESSYDATQNRQITAQDPRSYGQAYIEGGGYLTTLGSPDVENGKFVQVYSIDNQDTAFVDFSIVLENPSRQCGMGYSIDTMRYNAEYGVQSSSMNASVKNCSSKNQTIVLKNMLRSMIVAQRN